MGFPETEKVKKQVSTSMIVFAAVVVGVGLGLLGLNHWHATRCAEAHSPEEIKGFMDALTKRMLTAESQTYHNSLLMEKVISSLEQRLVIQEASELQSYRSILKTRLCAWHSNLPPNHRQQLPSSHLT